MNPNNSKTIICHDVPATLLHKTEAIRYFKTFGSIIKIIVKPKSKKCIIEYGTLDAAEEAFSLGGEYEGIEFPIEFQVKPPKQKARKDTDPVWDKNEDVKSELEAMGLTGHQIGFKKQYNLHHEKMAVDVELNTLVKKVKKHGGDASAVKKASLAAERDLLLTVKQQAETTEDKYRLLDARDKLIRLRKFRNVDVHMLGVTVGTCPDMCPEKERLMREVQHQVALYEAAADRSIMNHAIAVKQYSRSSADQETPLPHELRGVTVLQMTMGYLMHRIMDLADSPDVNLGEWYHFLWDRMRGIRKDITQQELCCQGSVRLVEQCARFHVHCSARLVAEDPAVFDQKINTENLTKCLQTLKYMYADLALQRERCAEEAEFRAYIILLNLNDGNFMWEVQQLPVDIQKSPEIKFALEVYSSIDKNNFVKFFKLVRQTTYLNACILLRYFLQVRSKAMRTITRCYTPRMPHAQFPIAQLTDMLAFESNSSCVDFVESCGLTVSSDKSSVVLNQKNFQEGLLDYALERAVNVIESKRQSSLGEVVCGEELPPPEYEAHIPQDSFTNDGYLKILDDLCGDVVTKDEMDKSIFKIRDRSNSPFMQGNSNSREDSQHGEGSSDLGTSVTDFKGLAQFGTGSSVSNSGNIFTMNEPSGFTFNSAPQKDQLFEKLRVEEEARQRKQKIVKAEEAERVRQQQLLLETQKQQELQKLKQAALERERDMELEIEKAREKQHRLLEEARLKAEERRLEAERLHQKRLQEEQERLKEIQQEEDAKHKRLVDAACKKQAAIEIAEAQRIRDIQSVVRNVVSKLVTDTENIYCTERLHELRIKTLSRFVLQKWRVKIFSNKRKRKAIDQGPLWINRLTTEQMAEELYTPQQELTLNLMKRYKKGVAGASSEGREMPSILRLDAPALRQLTANGLLRNAVKTKRLQNDIFWEIGIHFDGDENVVDETLQIAIGWDNRKVLLKRVKVNQNNLTYCLRKTKLFSQSKCLDDMNGLIIIVRRLTESLVDKLLEHLNTLGDLVCLPVFFILEEEDEQLNEELETLVKNKLISEKESLVCRFSSANLGIAIGRGLTFLSEYYRPPPSLQLNTLKTLLGENLGGEFFQRVRAFSKWNLSYKRCIAKPHVAIGIFNQGLQKLEDIVLNHQRYEHPGFPSIFKVHLVNEIPDYLPCDYKYFPVFWKSEDYNLALKEAFQQFQLPDYHGEWPLDPGPDLERHMLNYCQTVCSKKQDSEKLYLKVIAKLFRAYEKGNQSWLDIIEVILEHNLDNRDLSLINMFKTRTIFNQLIAIYQSDDLQSFASDSWFYLKNSLICEEIESLDEDETNEGFVDDGFNYFEAEAQEEVKFELEMHLKRAFEPDPSEDERRSNAKKCRAALDNFRNLLDDLEKSMKIQRVISEKFQVNLKNCLDSA